VVVAFTVLAMRLVGLANNSTLPKQRHPRPVIEQTITPEEIAPLRLEFTKEAPAAENDVSSVKHHKR
jgi:hypothetical protein